MFVEFVNEVARFIREVDKIKPQNCLVILDNALINQSLITEETLKIVGFSVAFISQYTPEMAPIERHYLKAQEDCNQ